MRLIMAQSKEEKAAYDKDRREANKERVAAIKKAWNQANKEKTAAYNKAWREANKEWVVSYNKTWYKVNKEMVNVTNNAYYKANREKVIESNNTYRKANREKVRVTKKAYYQANKEKCAATKKAWREANPDKNNALVSRRRALKLKLIPKHLNKCPVEKQRLLGIYKLSILISKATGIQHHVDHMWPLSDGGPHWSGNLQIITAHENMSKHASVDLELKHNIQQSLKETM